MKKSQIGKTRQYLWFGRMTKTKQEFFVVMKKKKNSHNNDSLKLDDVNRVFSHYNQQNKLALDIVTKSTNCVSYSFRQICELIEEIIELYNSSIRLLQRAEQTIKFTPGDYFIRKKYY